MQVPERLRSADLEVAVLCGGRSSEREVSLRSGAAVASGLESAGIPCTRFDLEHNSLPRELNPLRHLVIPMIHGTYGEDGTLSAELDFGGFAYAGSQMAASVLCFDKLACRGIAASCDLAVASACLLDPAQPETYRALAARLGEEFVLKPRADGSSWGLFVVRNVADYAAAQGSLKQGFYLAESYVRGMDVTVGILNGKPLAVVSVEPQGGDIYDYQHKYTPGLSRYRAPADIGESVATRLGLQAAAVFSRCGCRDFARVDFRLGPGSECVFLEINTIPGMTQTSLLPMSASACGIRFTELLISWVALAASRHPSYKEQSHG